MNYSPLFDRLWDINGINPLNNPFELELYMREINKQNQVDEYELLETETFEYLKGDFRTTITCKFNEKGYLVSHTAECIDISEDRAIMSEMKDELFKALDEERYEDVKIYQEKINNLRQILEIQKPTL